MTLPPSLGLPDPTPIDDFIEQSVQEMASLRAMPDYAGDHAVRSYYYSLENICREFPRNDAMWMTCRRPLFTPCYEPYEVRGFAAPVSIIAPNKEAAGRPCVQEDADELGGDHAAGEAEL